VSRRTLITVYPRNPATGVAQAVRLGGGGRAPLYHDGQHYRAGLVRSPRFAARLSFDENGWTGGTLPTTGTIAFAPAEASLLEQLAALYWPGASIVVEVGPEEGPFATRLSGTVADASAAGGRLVLTIADLSAGIDKPLVTSRFAGTGGIEGVAEAEGRLKRRSWGRVYNVEGRILDKANSIYEFGDPARPLQGFDALRDKGSAGSFVGVAWQGSVAATFAALQAAQAPQGGGVVAPSIACAKWWTQPSGPITADLRGELGPGYVDDVVGLAGRVLAAAGGPVIGNAVEAAAWRPGPAGLHIGDENETAAQAIDRLLLGCSLLWVLDPAGAIQLRQISFDNPVEVLKPISSTRQQQLRPTRARRVGYRRNQRQHSDGEIAAVLRGSDVAYSDNTPIDALRPQEGGANKTETRTSAGIAGQGALATANTAQWGSQVAGPGKPADNATVGAIFGANLLEQLGGNVALLEAFKTILGTAAAISGQGPGATAAADKVLNNSLSDAVLRIPSPVGATFGGGSPNMVGAVKIRLPQSWTQTMLRFHVDLYDYVVGNSVSYLIGGYNTWGQWVAEFAQMIGPHQRALPVRFGHDESRCCVWIGEPNTFWQFPVIRVRDFQAGYFNIDEALWDDGWSISLDTSPAINSFGPLRTVANPRAADAVFGFNMFESIDGIAATLSAFKTILGMAGSISGQGQLATQNAAAWASQVTGAGKPADNATVGAVAGVNLLDALAGALLTLTMIKTSLGTAAAIAGQGSLATRNNIDWNSADILNKPQMDGNGRAFIGFSGLPSGVVQRVVPAGGVVALDASIVMNSSISATRTARIEVAPSGGSYSTALSGSPQPSFPSEPYGDTIVGFWTNNTGIKQLFSFRVNADQTSGLSVAPGLLSQNFLSVG